MLFNLALGLRPDQTAAREVLTRILERTAVRAIIWRGPQLLMVRTASGDYKFPGGGVDGSESHLDALRREVREETGYSIDTVGDCAGVAAERMPDRFEPDTLFAMISHYYPATVAGRPAALELDAYEAALDFQPVWIEPGQAIAANEAILLQNRSVNRWVYRETAVLRILRDLA